MVADWRGDRVVTNPGRATVAADPERARSAADSRWARLAANPFRTRMDSEQRAGGLGCRLSVG